MGSGGGLCAVVVDRGGGGLYFLFLFFLYFMLFLWVKYVILFVLDILFYCVFYIILLW